MLILNTDSQEITNFEKTPFGYLKLWLSIGVADSILEYDDRKEKIDKAGLLNGINSAVGMPLSLSHPPIAISIDNRKDLAVGSTLQEYAFDSTSKSMYMASMIWDAIVADKVVNKEITHTSSAYIPQRILQEDGVYLQKSRLYNHFALLTSNEAPRAGQHSKILLLDNKMSNTDSKDKKSDPTNNDSLVAEKVELLSTWKSVLEENKKAIDYSVSCDAIKKQILSCFYPEEYINQLNKDSSLIPGAWLSFIAVKNTDSFSKNTTTKSSVQTDSFDKLQQEEISKYEKQLSSTSK